MALLCTTALYHKINKDPQVLYRLWVALPLRILKGRTSIVDSPEPGSEGETFTPNTRLWAILSRVVTVKDLTLLTRLIAQRRVVTVKNITVTTRHSPAPGIEREYFHVHNPAPERRVVGVRIITYITRRWAISRVLKVENITLATRRWAVRQRSGT